MANHLHDRSFVQEKYLNLNKDINHNLTTKCRTGLGEIGREKLWTLISLTKLIGQFSENVSIVTNFIRIVAFVETKDEKNPDLACKQGISMNTSVVHHQNNPERFGDNLRYLYFRSWKWIQVMHCELKSQTSTTQMASCWLKLSFFFLKALNISHQFRGVWDVDILILVFSSNNLIYF